MKIRWPRLTFPPINLWTAPHQPALEDTMTEAAERDAVQDQLCSRIDELEAEKGILATQVQQAEEEREDLQTRYHLLASEMVYEGNSVQHWRQKALAYKECAGAISDLKQIMGVNSPAETVGAVKSLAAYVERLSHSLATCETCSDVGLTAFGDDCPECSKPESPEWNGEGLPPVGCECEFEYCEVGAWVSAKVIGYDGPTCVVALDGFGYFGSDRSGDFRPIRSEEDWAVEEMERAYRADPSSPSVTHGIKHIYAAIRDGKIPGVKLEDAS